MVRLSPSHLQALVLLKWIFWHKRRLYYELVSASHRALGSASLCLCVCGFTQGHLSPCDTCTPPLGDGYACCTPPQGITVHYILTDTQWILERRLQSHSRRSANRSGPFCLWSGETNGNRMSPLFAANHSKSHVDSGEGTALWRR